MTQSTQMNTEKLLQLTQDAARQYHRLVLVVGPHGSGKTALFENFGKASGAEILNVSFSLAERLLELTQRQRALKAHEILGELISEAESDLLLLDDIEIVFDPVLKQDALRLFQELSRRRTLVVAWPGHFAAGSLTYAEPGHPEYCRHQNVGALVVNLEEGN